MAIPSSANQRLQRSVGRWELTRVNVQACREEPDPVRGPEHLWAATAVAAGAAGDVATARWLAAGEPVSPKVLGSVVAAATALRAELDLLLWHWQVHDVVVGRVAQARVDEIRSCLDEARAILADLPDEPPEFDDEDLLIGYLDAEVADPDTESPVEGDSAWFHGPDESV